MVDSYKIMTAVKSTLARKGEHVGRPMSLRLVIVIWLVLTVVSLIGFYDYFFGF
jgi:hypothetical protein